MHPIFFLIGSFASLKPSYLSSLYTLDISPLLNVKLVKVFSHSVDCCFVRMTVSFALQKLSSFTRSRVLIVDVSAHAVRVLFGKSVSVPMTSNLFPTFSSTRLSVSGFRLRSLIYVDLSFEQGNKYGSAWILLHVIV